MKSTEPTFQDYHQALQRLQRRARLRRAVMTRGVNTSFEIPVLDDEEIRDRQICRLWQDRHTYFGEGS
jgi:hypothetical protein